MKLLCKVLQNVQCHYSLHHIGKKVSRSQATLLKMFCTLGKNIPDKTLSTTVAYLLSGTRCFWFNLACDVLNPPKKANHSQGTLAAGLFQSP